MNLNRNVQTYIQSDIETIQDIIDCLDEGDLDSAYDYLDEWKEELESMVC